MALNVLSRFAEARKEALRASKLRGYDDYALSEGEVLIRALERKLGYRGEALRTVIYASIPLPHYSSIKGTVGVMLDRCPKEERLELQWALLQIQYVIGRNSSTYIGVLVAKACMSLTLARQSEFHTNAKEESEREAARRQFFLGRAERLRSQLSEKRLLSEGQDPARMLQEVWALQEAGRQEINIPADPIFQSLFLWPIVAARLLMGLAGLLLALPLARLWANKSPEAFCRARGTAALGLLGLFGAVFANIASGSPVSWAPLAMSVPVLALAALQAKGGSIKLLAIAYSIAFLLLGLTAGVAVGLAGAGLVLAFIGIVWLAERWSWLASTAAIVAFGIATFSLRAPEFGSMGPLLVVPIALAAGCLLLAFPPKWVDRGAAGAVLALTAGYVFVVAKDVADDAWLKRFNPQFISEADRARKKAGLPRLSPEVPTP